ncbi:polysaccharide biosynthesis/export family protein [Lysobacter sp. CA196]|uniref:polysaccharide biosynthesis/export family protein n=1 Tax=Lysobacter sp. CA196 TaxID=3455606 RepID=UPI003F8D83E6
MFAPSRHGDAKVYIRDVRHKIASTNAACIAIDGGQYQLLISVLPRFRNECCQVRIEGMSKRFRKTGRPAPMERGNRAGMQAVAAGAYVLRYTLLRPALGFHRVCLALLLLILPLSAAAQIAGRTAPGTASIASVASNEASNLPPDAVSSSAAYRIAPGDELALKFFYVPELNENVTVRPDGRIHLQLVGEVPAAELTPAELAAALKRAYAGSLRQPEVSVEVEKGFARQQVFVGGEVGRPGAQPLLPSLTVMRALIVAQGLRDTAAANRVVILRRGDDGRGQVIRVDVASQSRNGADAANDPLLQPFDVVLAVPSHVSRLNRWIDQYIRRNLPVNVGFSYDLNDNRSGY